MRTDSYDVFDTNNTCHCVNVWYAKALWVKWEEVEVPNTVAILWVECNTVFLQRLVPRKSNLVWETALLSIDCIIILNPCIDISISDVYMKHSTAIIIVLSSWSTCTGTSSMSTIKDSSTIPRTFRTDVQRSVNSHTISCIITAATHSTIFTEWTVDQGLFIDASGTN